MPTRSVTPAVDFQKSPPNASLPPTAITSSPKATVATAAHRNHQSARQVILSNALFRAAPSISAYAGVCTKLKNHSSPIHIIATTTWAIRRAPDSPALLKISIGTPRSGVRPGRNVPKSDGRSREGRRSSLGVRQPPGEEPCEVAVGRDRVRQPAAVGDGPPHRRPAVLVTTGKPTHDAPRLRGP